MAFPIDLTGFVDRVTVITAAQLNALEVKIGVDASAVVTSLDYLLKNPASIDPGHLHSVYALLAGRGGQTLIGGTGVADILKLQGTSGNGTLTSPAVQALVGNNGATVGLSILNNGLVIVGTIQAAQIMIGNSSGSYGSFINGGS
ncbi:MAG TPA: hypothetical protein VIN67_08250, partial [Desulfobaccales bacterium]